MHKIFYAVGILKYIFLKYNFNFWKKIKTYLISFLVKCLDMIIMSKLLRVACDQQIRVLELFHITINFS
jgi:hypothetical protein